MATTIYTDDNGNRVVIRHKGPPGVGFPPGGTTGQIIQKTSSADYAMAWVNAPSGTGAAVGPNSSLDATVVLFDGTTGKLLKDSTRTVSYFSTRAYAETKVDKITGKGLSQEDFTTAEKAKLAALGVEHYKGVFADVEDIPPGGAEGDYATVEVDGEPLGFFVWDVTNSEWADVSRAAGMSGTEIATALFKTDETYDKESCRVFTTSNLDTLNGAASQAFVNAALSAAGLGTASYGHTEYFNLTGTAIAIGAVSDGSSNMVKVDVATTLASETVSFDAGSSTARMRYTVASVRLFKVDAVLSVSAAAGDVLVFGLAKNGSVVGTSRTIKKIGTDGEISSTTISTIVSLTINDYIEVFVGNTTDTSSPQVHTFALFVTPA